MRKFIILLIFAIAFFACTTEPKTKTWTLTLDANGGTGLSTTSYTVNDGDTQELTETPTRTNYTFLNWNTKADGSGTEFNSGVTIVSNDLTIYAIWGQLNPTVTFKTATGDVQTQYANGDTLVLPDTITSFDYRKTASNTLEKQIWQDQYGNELKLGVKVVKDLTYTELWRASNIEEITDDFVGSALSDNRKYYEVYTKANGKLSWLFCVASNVTGNSTFADSDLASISNTTKGCSLATDMAYNLSVQNANLFNFAASLNITIYTLSAKSYTRDYLNDAHYYNRR